MLNDATCFKTVYIVCGYTDLRSGMDRLAALIEAQAKAEANRIISESITDRTQRQDAIEKWDGKLPKYVGGEDGASFGILEMAGDDQ